MALLNFKKRETVENGPVNPTVEAFLKDYSIEVMPRTAEKVEDFRALLPEGTRVYIAHIEGTPIEDMVATAKRLAAEGYAALAIDVYGEGVTTEDPGEAGHRMNELLDNPKELLARALAGSKQLHDMPETCRDRMGAVGFCFGGKIVLDMARSGLKLKAVATFHGNLSATKRAEPGDIKAELLIAHGGEDSMVSMEVVEDFKEEMDAAGVSYELDIYEGAKHGFTNPKIDERAEQNDLDLAYNAAASEQSWQKMLKFFERTLKA